MLQLCTHNGVFDEDIHDLVKERFDHILQELLESEAARISTDGTSSSEAQSDGHNVLSIPKKWTANVKAKKSGMKEATTNHVTSETAKPKVTTTQETV